MASKIKLTFLGTAANIPTARRNHSGILLSYNEENILVDCGEGIQRQFRKAKLNPCKITKILLTHKHGDHTFGLPGLISTLNSSEYNRELVIFGPKGIKNYLENLLDLANVSRCFKLEIKEISGRFFEQEDFYLESEKMDHGVPINGYNFILKDKLRIDKKKLEKSGVPPGSHLKKLSEGKDVVFGKKKFRAKDLTYIEKGKKISIILDSLPNPRIKDFIKGADIFISEASFLSNENETAKEKGHSTIKETSKIAKEGKVNLLILTHISQKYEVKLKEILEEAKENFKKVKIAEDLDKIEI
jgi:ribonuclease Z